VTKYLEQRSLIVGLVTEEPIFVLMSKNILSRSTILTGMEFAVDMVQESIR
jgi:replication-associated recombination protein RarA